MWKREEHGFVLGRPPRAAIYGYPERYAQRVLGQNSKIIHRAYAKKAQGEVYEEANRKAKESGKILVLQHEAEVPKVA